MEVLHFCTAASRTHLHQESLRRQPRPWHSRMLVTLHSSIYFYDQPSSHAALLLELAGLRHLRGSLCCGLGACVFRLSPSDRGRRVTYHKSCCRMSHRHLGYVQCLISCIMGSGQRKTSSSRSANEMRESLPTPPVNSVSRPHLAERDGTRFEAV